MSAPRETFMPSRTAPPSEKVEFEPPAAEQLTLPKGVDRTTRLALNTWNKFGGLLTALAQQFHLDPAAALALFVLETEGRTFGPDGRLIIRFENHVFYDLWGKQHPDVFQDHFLFHPENRWVEHQWRPDPAQKWRPSHTDQKEEWRQFEFASTLDETAALEALGLGGAQLMGFNYARLGYPSAQAMFQAFCADERPQIMGFFDFTLGSPVHARRLAALQGGRLEEFARLYHGPGQAQRYAGLLQMVIAAFNQMTGLRPSA